MKTQFLLILIFLISFTSSECLSNQIDLNSASLSELDKLEGIGSVKAQSIIDSRPFSRVDDLKNVKGIGDVTLEKIKSQGLACVSTEEEIQQEKSFETNNETSIIQKEYMTAQVIKEEQPQSENVINLNPEIVLSDNSLNQKVVYESKNQTVKKYILYAFCLFLIFLILILLIKK